MNARKWHILCRCNDGQQQFDGAYCIRIRLRQRLRQRLRFRMRLRQRLRQRQRLRLRLRLMHHCPLPVHIARPNGPEHHGMTVVRHNAQTMMARTT